MELKFTNNVNVINPSPYHLPFGPGTTHNVYFDLNKIQLINLMLLGDSTCCCYIPCDLMTCNHWLKCD